MVNLRAFALALALLLGVVTQAQAAAPAPCSLATPGTLMHNVRYAATFLVVSADPAHGRAFGTFPGTPYGDAIVPVKCVDLVRLADLTK